jgi:hypothetical protein
MLPIATQFEESGFRYTQLTRQGDIAIYSQEHKGSGVVRYEVVRIRVQAERTWPNGLVTPEREAYPGASSWGRDGTTHYTLENAQTHAATLGQAEEPPVSQEETA